MPAKKNDKAPVAEEVKEEVAEAKEEKKEKKAEKKEVKVKEKKAEKKAPAKKPAAKKEEKKTEKKNKKEAKPDSKAINIGDEKHGNFYNDVEVNCICGANFTINTTVPGPIKVETCYQCHPIYNKDKVIKKVVKGRLEKFLEKQKRIDSMKK